MAYPSRPVLKVLPEFAGRDGPTNYRTARGRAELERLDAFVSAEYEAGRSLRQIAELTGRTQTAVRRSLDRTGTPRRGRGAPPASIEASPSP